MTNTVEERLARVERAIEQIKKASHISGLRNKAHWITEITGTFKDDEVFEEILRLGREERNADRVTDKE